MKGKFPLEMPFKGKLWGCGAVAGSAQLAPDVLHPALSTAIFLTLTPSTLTPPGKASCTISLPDH